MFFPANIDFFALFEAQTNELLKAMDVLRQLKENGDVRKYARKMKEIEHNADLVAHEILNNLNKTFITPFEREDIQVLTHRIDEVLDQAERVVNRIAIYKINPIPNEIFESIELINNAVQELSRGICELKDPEKRQVVLECCRKIGCIESECDDHYRASMEKLFESEMNAVMIIKLKEIYETLEHIVDRCYDVANVLETIVVKNI